MNESLRLTPCANNDRERAAKYEFTHDPKNKMYTDEEGARVRGFWLCSVCRVDETPKAIQA